MMTLFQIAEFDPEQRMIEGLQVGYSEEAIMETLMAEVNAILDRVHTGEIVLDELLVPDLSFAFDPDALDPVLAVNSADLVHINHQNHGAERLFGSVSIEQFIADNPDWEFYTLRPDVLIDHTLADWMAGRDTLLEFMMEQLH